MRATELLPVETPEVAEIVDEIVSAGGEISAEQEARLDEILKVGTTMIDMARRVKEMELWCETSLRWRQARRELEKVREAAIGSLKDKLVAAFERHKFASPLKGADDAKLTYVKARDVPPSVDPGYDVNEIKEKHVSGLTAEDVARTGIPSLFFEPVIVYKLKSDIVREYLQAKTPVGNARLVDPCPHVRISIPGL